MTFNVHNVLDPVLRKNSLNSGGQPRFRSMWERYCRGVNAIVYMVDAADGDKIEASRNELHNLLEKPQGNPDKNNTLNYRDINSFSLFAIPSNLIYTINN